MASILKCRQKRPRHYHTASPHDIEELYNLNNDPQERRNLADKSEMVAVKKELKERLFAWMEAEGDWLTGPAHHPPVGSNIDGRERSEQHDHNPGTG